MQSKGSVALAARADAREVAARLGVDQRTARSWRSGAKLPSAHHADVLKSLYGIPLEAWHQNADAPPKAPRTLAVAAPPPAAPRPSAYIDPEWLGHAIMAIDFDDPLATLALQRAAAAGHLDELAAIDAHEAAQRARHPELWDAAEQALRALAVAVARDFAASGDEDAADFVARNDG